MGPITKEKSGRIPQYASVGESVVWGTALLRSAGVDTARLDAECLLASLLRCSRLHLYAAKDDPLPLPILDRYRALLARRQAREPLAYLTGTKEFWSLSLQVTPAVLIPRPETEVLVEAVLTRLGKSEVPVIADIGTGSGAVAVAVAKALPRARIYATEISEGGLEVARANARIHGVLDRIRFLRGSLLEPLLACGLTGRCDLIVSNPPYVPTQELGGLSPEIQYEPPEALDGGVDGMDCHRRIIGEASAFLGPGGWVVLEMAAQQGVALADFIRDRGHFTDIAVLPDLSGRPRVIVARLAGPDAPPREAGSLEPEPDTLSPERSVPWTD